jgi:hypothetical protein
MLARTDGGVGAAGNRLTSPAEHASPSQRTLVDPWVERALEPSEAAPRRVHPEQPDHGLLWVLTGGVTVRRGSRSREVRPGSVVSYRVGDALTWSAGEGTRVRWSARPVTLEPGEVASWTANLALEIPPTETTAPRRRAGIYATAAIALSWILALTVAWCYDQAQAMNGSRPR